jgi:phage terminase small subunit
MRAEHRERIFVERYLVDPNGREAAIAAGYSVRGAAVTASKLLKKPSVVALLNAQRRARSEQAAIDAAWVLRRLVQEAEADLADIYDSKGALRPVEQWPLIWRQGLLVGVDVQEIIVGSVKIGETKKLRLADRIKRLELIGKHVGVQAFKEQIEVTGLDKLGERLARAAKFDE